MKYKNKKPEIHPSKRHLTKEDVERAIRNTNSNRMASRFLSVSVPNWKKWATTYMDESGVSYYERHLNKCGKGVTKVKNLKNALADVLSGKLPPWHMKKRDIKESLIIEGYFKEECNRCGFCERTGRQRHESSPTERCAAQRTHGHRRDHDSRLAQNRWR